ncbi:MAG: acyl carrier protein [Actinomycetota bacterium]|nr:acyl carrier protein [Actinomycetota bacterium]
MTTSEDVRRRIAHVLELPVERVVDSAVLTELVTDSFRLVELAIDLQEEYDVMFGQADMKGLRTVADLVALVHNRLP